MPPPPPEAEFIDYTPFIIDEKEAIETELENFGVIAEIQRLAMDAKMTGDDTKLINYLKRNNLYELCQKKADESVIDDDREEDEWGGFGGSSGGSDGKHSLSVENLQSEDFIDGDIFLKHDKSSSGSSNNGNSSSGSNIVNFFIGHWGHAAFVDVEKRGNDKSYFLLSANVETEQGKSRVGYDKIKDYWSIATEVAICRVKNQSQYERKKSIEYAREFIGKPYNIACKRMSNSHFYCSKVVYRGWLSQGVELEPHNNWIKIFKFWRWNYKKRIGIKWWYPEFKTIYIKDPWITPNDLYYDNDVELIRNLK